jgi:hypothetical protein
MAILVPFTWATGTSSTSRQGRGIRSQCGSPA